MFRVDPAFKRTLSFAQVRGQMVEDYDFLQLTQSRPIWILRDRSNPTFRYMFNNFAHSIEFASRETWRRHALYALLPEEMTADGRMMSSLVTQVWLCDKNSKKDLCFEIQTESGTYQLNQFGSKVRKTKRNTLLWVADMGGMRVEKFKSAE